MDKIFEIVKEKLPKAFVFEPPKVPAGAQPEWIILNADHFLYGQRFWLGEGQFGCYYAALDPEDRNTVDTLKANLRQPVALVVYISPAKASAMFVEWRERAMMRYSPASSLPDAALRAVWLRRLLNNEEFAMRRYFVNVR